VAGITEAELLQALQDALRRALENPDADGALTVHELEDALGWDVSKVRKTLRALKNDGHLKCVKVRRLAIDDSTRVVPAYRLTGETEA